MRNNFGKNNLFNITLEEFKEALGLVIEGKGKINEPPYGMYT